MDVTVCAIGTGHANTDVRLLLRLLWMMWVRVVRIRASWTRVSRHGGKSVWGCFARSERYWSSARSRENRGDVIGRIEVEGNTLGSCVR